MSTILDLKHKIKEFELTQTIKLTNIEELYEYAEIKKRKCQLADFVIFKNNIKNGNLGKLKPLIWIHINDENLDCLSFLFPKTNCFAGRSVMIKMIDCEKKDGD